MNSPRPAALLMGLLVLLLVVELLRRRQLREKFAAIWLGIGVVAVVVGVFPPVLERATKLLGFAVPANLLFFAGSLVLTAICMQLSHEAGLQEERSRRLAEEIALLRLDVDRLTEAVDADSAATPVTTPPAGDATTNQPRVIDLRAAKRRAVEGRLEEGPAVR